MQTYTADQLVKMGSEQIDQIQSNCDSDALDYITEKTDELTFMTKTDINNLKEYYTDTMEKYRLLYEAFVYGLSTEQKPGFPEHIYNIDLKDGSIETDKNGRRINYTTEILAPCTTSALHYINNDCNDMYIIFPPVKDIERTIEKLVEERQREHKELREKNLATFEEEPELPFNLSLQESYCPTVYNLQQQKIEQQTKETLLKITTDSILPKDIYRLSITSRYPQDLETLIKQFECKFPAYIKFVGNERNFYNKELTENPRRYLDRKKIARISIPQSNRYFYVEFQFKQTNMFFAHIRSHSVYEQARLLTAKYNTAQEAAQKKKGTAGYEEAKNKALQLKKLCQEKNELCIDIHKSAIHQSNFYVLNHVMWQDKNAEGLRHPKNSKGQYEQSIDFLKKNYIIESYEPFDGAMAFATTPNEYLNKSYYLKMIGSLPENFDELGKNAKNYINKAWENLTSSDIKNFDLVTATAIKYQDIIRTLQKEKSQQTQVPQKITSLREGR
ncbi:MAG: hypothetical protein IJ864_00115 [Alphaproteobacteria bacterium]|nr:hypothetical protein [Alphaproteobacteria bacterium]